jgi:ABC-type polysaccharide/polyol phosphate export permease
VLAVNPLGLIFTGMHQAIFENRIPDALHLGVPLAWSAIALLTGYFMLKVGRKKGLVELL